LSRGQPAHGQAVENNLATRQQCCCSSRSVCWLLPAVQLDLTVTAGTLRSDVMYIALLYDALLSSTARRTGATRELLSGNSHRERTSDPQNFL